jgi:hypothetical protein
MPDSRGNVPGSIFALTFATALLGGTAAAWPIHFAPRRPDCLAEDAAGIEPVSEVKFPSIREKNREFCKFNGSSTLVGQKITDFLNS